MAASEAPPFWWEKPDWRAWALWPLSSAYGFAASARLRAAKREKIPAAVLCIGNLTVGGEGKTPIAIALARHAMRKGLTVGFLSRGYGGSHFKPHIVSPEDDSARAVGDEPLLLARQALTVISRDRAAGARRLVQAGCNLIIMDDGFQSARLHMDYALIVVDAMRGLGNGHVFPAGPMRAPLTEQMRFADGVVTMGEGDAADIVVRSASRAGRPVYSARIRPRSRNGLKGKRVLAFAGIGNPRKFYATLKACGADIVLERSFPDHHLFTEEDVSELSREAAKESLLLVTTEKDFVRLQNSMQPMRDFAASVQALKVEAVFDEPGAPDAIINAAQQAWRERMLKR
ncbi:MULTISPECIES: tetraacyldisaccharide 4'-kinase [Chelativorans]|jgi:tetraacyldisaccharide 4'-kinase|uniref:Tetraacyldisaccharide 4'-kinase n=1 Tax=Chelativorans sp. (strain BNC1) TaxID=266779 RepID=LPXK_CHESB|nr:MULTISPECIES: tetraacyldisaccharide 4'-kinase [Chelativorans]Q11L82.1 RecName: Full=Tetraacyldisaccharide 4'-kinase; AltName: Full=Lipid A 4'-kinase [Chelativorans sp. BNC1]